jgi:hypothetical protein
LSGQPYNQYYWENCCDSIKNTTVELRIEKQGEQQPVPSTVGVVIPKLNEHLRPRRFHLDFKLKNTPLLNRTTGTKTT